MPRIVILFDRLGPYHVARLRAAALHADVIAIEASPDNTEYPWSQVEIDRSFQHVPIRAGEKASVDDRRRQAACVVHAVLKEKPDCVAVPGWSSIEAVCLIAACAAQDIPLICMSESNRFDAPRLAPREFIKRRIVAHFSAGVATSRSQLDYLHELGLPTSALFSGYNVVDNAYFAEAAARVRAIGSMPEINEVPLPESARERYFLVTSRFIQKKNSMGCSVLMRVSGTAAQPTLPTGRSYCSVMASCVSISKHWRASLVSAPMSILRDFGNITSYRCSMQLLVPCYCRVRLNNGAS